jgi:transposase
MSDKQKESRKIDDDKVIELLEKNVSPKDIAQNQNVALSTIYRFIEKVSPKNKELERFKKNKATYLSDLNAKQHEILNLLYQDIIDTLREDIKSYSANEKRALIHSIQGGIGLISQEIREELGQGAQRVNQLTIIVEAAHRRDKQADTIDVTPEQEKQGRKKYAKQGYIPLPHKKS